MYSGSQVLISCLPSFFATFLVPEELFSGCGPELTATNTSDFLWRWNVHHRVSSSYFAQSNNRREIGVKAAKRLFNIQVEHWPDQLAQQ